jgi:hypothetical protein
MASFLQEDTPMDRKCAEMRRKIQEIESENEELTRKLGKSRNDILRLRLERRFLFEKLQQLHQEVKEMPKAPVPDYLSDSQASELSDEQVDVDEPIYVPSANKRRSKSIGAAAPNGASERAAAEATALHGSAARKGPTPFSIYCQAMRPTVQLERPELTFSEQSKLLNAQWKALPAEGKAQYELGLLDGTVPFQAAS